MSAMSWYQTLSNLYINRPGNNDRKNKTDERVALSARTDEGTTLRNVGSLGVKIFGFRKVASLVSANTITYDTLNESKHIVKHAAVEEAAWALTLKSVKESNGTLEPLNAVEKEAFAECMQEIKFAGLSLSIRSEAADKPYLCGIVEVDGQQFDHDRQQGGH